MIVGILLLVPVLSSASVGAAVQTTLRITAPSNVYIGSTTTINGTLTANGEALARQLVTLYKVSNSSKWDIVAHGMTDAGGNFAITFDGSPTVAKVTYVASYQGDATHASAVSNTAAVKYVDISTALTVAVSPQTVYAGQSVTISGVLTANGSGLPHVPINLYTVHMYLEANFWKYESTVVTNASGYYSFTWISPTAQGVWFKTSYDGDTTHASAFSVHVECFFTAIPTAISASLKPPQPLVGEIASINGDLTANGAALPATNVTLFTQNETTQDWFAVSNTMTSATGSFSFAIQSSVSGAFNYEVVYAGDAAHKASVDFVTGSYSQAPSSITAAATPQQQYVGEPVAIAGRLTANGVGLSGETVTLYNVDTMDWAAINSTTTNVNGYYNFSVTSSARGTHAYLVNYKGNNAYSWANSNTSYVSYVPVPTALSISAAPFQPSVGQQVTITGTLNTSVARLSGKSVTLYERQNYSWTNLSSTVTDATGHYSFSFTQDTINQQSESYTYETSFAGDVQYSSSRSADVTVTFHKISTSITASASNQTLIIFQNNTIAGTLTKSGVGLSGKLIQLCRSNTSRWIPIGSAMTDANGHYSCTFAETTVGPSSYYNAYNYMARYLGNGTDAASVSASIQVLYYNIPSVLTAAAQPKSPYVGKNATISGTLTANGIGLPGQYILLYRKANSGLLVPNRSTMTDASGAYAFAVTEQSAGSYTYGVGFLANGTYYTRAQTYAFVTFELQPTEVTAQANLSTQTVGHSVSVSGNLTSGTAPLPEKSLTLYRWDSVFSRWVSNNSTATNGSGGFIFSVVEGAPGTYNYVVSFVGDNAYAAADSAIISVTYV